MYALDPKYLAWEQQARPELLRSIQQRDGYPPTDSEDDLALMEDSNLDQAAILCGDMLAIREAMARVDFFNLFCATFEDVAKLISRQG